MENDLKYTFQSKLAVWLAEVKDILNKNPNIQEIMFDILNEDCSTFSTEENEVFKTTYQKFFKLTFILKSNPQELDKLINFLD